MSIQAGSGYAIVRPGDGRRRGYGAHRRRCGDARGRWPSTTPAISAPFVGKQKRDAGQAQPRGSSLFRQYFIASKAAMLERGENRPLGVSEAASLQQAIRRGRGRNRAGDQPWRSLQFRAPDVQFLSSAISAAECRIFLVNLSDARGFFGSWLARSAVAFHMGMFCSASLLVAQYCVAYS